VWCPPPPRRGIACKDGRSPPPETIQLHPDVALYGGLSGTEIDRGERDVEVNVTVLSGDLGSIFRNGLEGLERELAVMSLAGELITDPSCVLPRAHSPNTTKPPSHPPTRGLCPCLIVS
jgi:hypothetical protein